ncbi:MAG: hypothetical protein PWQ75_1832 [Methanolobus sp.]|jgi:hypothetical protein|nr:hypothetical protein [Methanolobus sp.]
MKIKRKMIARKLFTTAESYSSGMIIHAII